MLKCYVTTLSWEISQDIWEITMKIRCLRSSLYKSLLSDNRCITFLGQYDWLLSCVSMSAKKNSFKTTGPFKKILFLGMLSSISPINFVYHPFDPWFGDFYFKKIFRFNTTCFFLCNGNNELFLKLIQTVHDQLYNHLIKELNEEEVTIPG